MGFCIIQNKEQLNQCSLSMISYDAHSFSIFPSSQWYMKQLFHIVRTYIRAAIDASLATNAMTLLLLTHMNKLYNWRKWKKQNKMAQLSIKSGSIPELFGNGAKISPFPCQPNGLFSYNDDTFIWFDKFWFCFSDLWLCNVQEQVVRHRWLMHACIGVSCEGLFNFDERGVVMIFWDLQ